MSSMGKCRLHPLAIAVICLLSAQVVLADDSIDSDTESISKETHEAIELGRILVRAQFDGESGDAQGYDDVYSRDMSSVYRGKDEIQRNKGLSPADLLKGMTGVYSGDARNSGAIDVNIRGIQGQGRVPVTIDGTEQAISVYRGYFGVSNRNYVDPSMISSITVEKGATLGSGVKTSVGGGVAMTTIGIDDVVAKDQKFGVDFQMDTGSNTTKPRLPNMSLLGTDYRDDPMFDPSVIPLDHPSLFVGNKQRGSSTDFFNFRDYSMRLAAGMRAEYFDLMAAVSYRKQGNYFSGKRGSSFYSAESAKEHAFVPPVALTYKPGSEVLNTSSANKSLLIKNTWYLPEDQRLLLMARHSDINHGELMPSRLLRSENAEDAGLLQWPESDIKQKAYSIRYQWNPEDNRWIDADISLWKTTTDSNTYTTGDSIFGRDSYDGAWNWCMIVNNKDQSKCVRDGLFHPYVNKGLAHVKNTRWGVTASNTMELMDDLKFTAGIDFQKEKLRSDTKTREGRRQEYNLFFNFTWQPIPSVTINAGLRRDSYNSHDDLLAEKRLSKDLRYAQDGVDYMEIYTSRPFTQDEYDFYHSVEAELRAAGAMNEAGTVDYVSPGFQIWRENNNEKFQQYHKLWTSKTFDGGVNETYEFSQRGDGKYHREDNPLANGKVPQGKRIDPWTGKEVDNYVFKNINHKTKDAGDQKYAAVQKRSGHAWSPILSIGWDMTDYSKVYARYAESKRFPSMFEDTIGFTTNIRDFVHLKPEESRTFEVGYVYDLSWLPNTLASDIKISYYDMTLKNVIERDPSFNITQIDKQKTKGIELQARYESQRFFANAGINYNLKNKTCDDSASMVMDPSGDFPVCVDGGFPNGFLRTNMIPKYSVNLTVGGKFFDSKLEVGTSLNYHAKARNGQEEMMVASGKLNGDMVGNNAPIRWNSVFLVDAFLNYKIDDSLSMYFSGHNLTNQYYIDPLTRSYMPAPGRTFRIGLKGNF
ncbi:TonB-dependent receptor [Ignatzschineria rhizosphaerae]|uniref:TonB-dependent receptor n=1 Tax=Ignatzschineria rhizosphaerae TaxID=2923279 RepID=A0ABY3XBT6_9GAMM|nr:TonB-dependent receptor [Ignatzschineria rhizosphaerae]UNM97413.1 TonB-dependent receptor [Ignatzschineria rhizosphaerae]